MDTIGVNSGEKKTIEVCLNQHSDSEVYATKIQVLVDSKKNKYSEARILIVGRHRVYIFKRGKPKHEIFFLDIVEISSPSTTTLHIKSKSGLLQMEGAVEQLDEIIGKIYFSFASTFPAIKSQLTIMTIPEDRAPKVKSKIDPQLATDENCGGFTNTYTAVCDQLNIKPLEDLIWHINHLYVANEIPDFKLYECALRPGRLKSDDARALLTALIYNTYFTGLFIEHVKLDWHATTAITNILQNNKTLRRFRLKESALRSDVFFGFASAFERNPSLKITHIDWSDNNVDDKTILTLAANLAAFINGLSYLNLAGCGISSRATLVLFKALESHEITCQKLTYFNLSGNKIDAEGCKALSALFAKTPKLIDLNLASTVVDYRLLQKLETLENLDISGTKIITKDAKHTDMLRFLELAPNLTKLVAVGCNFPPEIFVPLLEAAPTLEYLDLTDNNLEGDVGLATLAEVLPTVSNSISSLILDKNFENKSKSRAKAVQAFSEYVASENCKLTALSIQGSTKGGTLKADLIPIAFALLSNRSLKKVNLNGNLAGNGLALAVNKFLQMNDVLEELYMDDNVLTVFGLQLIKAGLSCNYTLRTLPLPVDTTFLMKEHSKITLELLTDIQAALNTNASKHNQPGRERGFSMVLANNENNSSKEKEPSTSPLVASSSTEKEKTSGTGLTIAQRERSKSNADKPLPTPPLVKAEKTKKEKFTLSATISGRKKKSKKGKASALDVKHASALFASLNEEVASPDGIVKEPEKDKKENENNNAKQEAPKK